MSIHVPHDVREELKAHALRWFNQERVTRLGLEPLDELPQATPGTPKDCLICRSLGGGRTGGLPIRTNNVDYSVGCSDWTSRETPDYVFAFACAFDIGGLPELIAEGAEASPGAWSETSQRAAQQIIDRLAAEIRAQREAPAKKNADPVASCVGVTGTHEVGRVSLT